jgi:hypothetical protein
MAKWLSCLIRLSIYFTTRNEVGEGKIRAGGRNSRRISGLKRTEAAHT